LEELFNEPKTEKSKDKSNDVEPESFRKGSDAPIIKDWVSNDEKEKVEKNKVKPSIKRINFVKPTTDINPRETVKNVNSTKSVSNVINKAHSNVRRPFNQRTTFKNRNMNQKVNAVKRNSVNTVVGNEDRLKLKELMKLCTKLFDRVLDLEKTKTAQAKEIANLKKKVKKLERKRRFRTPRMNLLKIRTSRRRSLAKVNVASKYGNYFLKLMFEEKLQQLVNADINVD
nr:hypothetical protein [Tanacetum cinerariifolium]